MKLFVAVYQEDGRTIKAPGISETEVKQMERFIVAENIEQVWEHIKELRLDPERQMIGVWEKVASVEIIERHGGDERDS